MLSKADIDLAVASIQDPYRQQSLLQLGAVEVQTAERDRIRLVVQLPYPARGLHGAIETLLRQALPDEAGAEEVEIIVSSGLSAHTIANGVDPLPGVRNIVAVASGKGGVGKSTVAVNLALALHHEGARVGILDADIHGPSLGMMMGVEEGARPRVEGEKWFVPLEAHGVQLNSMAFLTTDKTPMVWRGPMVSGALMQLCSQTRWSNLDVLIVDLPPGTGDIQLTLAQKIPVTAAVVVTTPQDIALLDARKGIEMFARVNVPVLGVVENMSYFQCSHCGESEPVFGEGGGGRIAQEYGVPLLGCIPLHRTIREQTDGGKPTVVAEPDSPVARQFIEAARAAMAELSRRPRATDPRFSDIIGRG